MYISTFLTTSFSLSIVYFLLLIFCLSAVLFYCYGIYAAIASFNHAHPIDINFHSPVTILRLAITWVMRLVMGWVVGVRNLQDSCVQKYFWIVPLRDLVTFVIWCCGLFGSTIEWRGRQLRLTKDGKLVEIRDDFAKVLSS